MLTVGDRFPRFEARACVGLNKDDFKDLSHNTYEGKWVCYFFYPKDFTFVCPTELAEFAKQTKAFRERDCEVVGGSTDNEFSHLAWRKSQEDLRNLPYPLINASKLARELGILDEKEAVCHRATFLVDPHGVVQFAAVYAGKVGRNVNEVLRTLDALQSDELCPCNWKKGDAHIKL